jgi:hypothetical protein
VRRRTAAPTLRLHRDLLPTVIAERAQFSGRLDLAALIEDIGRLPAPLIEVFEAALDWLAKGARDPLALRPVYAMAERSRKRLPNGAIDGSDHAESGSRQEAQMFRKLRNG